MQRPRKSTQSFCVCAVVCFLVCCTSIGATSEANWIHNAYLKGDFKLVNGLAAADIVVSSNDFKVVQIAAKDLADDVSRVTGKKPAILTDVTGVTGHAVIVGTLGQSS